LHRRNDAKRLRHQRTDVLTWLDNIIALAEAGDESAWTRIADLWAGRHGVGGLSRYDADRAAQLVGAALPTTPHGLLMLTVLGGLAEFERELIRARTDDGRKRQEAIQRLVEGAVQADLARTYGVSEATISRLAHSSPFERAAVGL
jgi:Resolvase, N terminal domain